MIHVKVDTLEETAIQVECYIISHEFFFNFFRVRWPQYFYLRDALFIDAFICVHNWYIQMNIENVEISLRNIRWPGHILKNSISYEYKKD